MQDGDDTERQRTQRPSVVLYCSLNIDLCAPGLRYVRNLRGLNGGEDFGEGMLTGLFQRISDDEIRLTHSDSAEAGARQKESLGARHETAWKRLLRGRSGGGGGGGCGGGGGATGGGFVTGEGGRVLEEAKLLLESGSLSQAEYEQLVEVRSSAHT